MSLQCQKIEIKKLPFYASDITNFTSAVCAVVLEMSSVWGGEPIFESWANTYSGDLYSSYTTVLNFSSSWINTDDPNVNSFVYSNSANILAVDSLVNSNSGNWNSVYNSYNSASAGFLTNSSADVRYVKLSGDVMTGGLSSPSLSTNNLYVAGSTINFFNESGNVIETLKSNDVGNFKSNYTLTNSRSANWEAGYSNFSSQSANNSSVYNTVQTNSGSWNYQGTDIKSLTSNWENTYTNFSIQSGNNISVYNTFNSNSGNYNSTYNTVQTYSAAWIVDSTVDIGVRALTSNWENTYNTVQSNSSTTWNYQGTDIKALTSNWQATYTNFSVQSGNNLSVYNTVNSNSGNWNYSYHTILTGGTIGGNVSVSGNLSAWTADVNYIDFNSTVDNPPYQEGRLFYDNNDNTLSLYVDNPDVTLNLGQEMWVLGVNKTGSIITQGTVVYLSGAQGNRPKIWPALANNDLGSADTIGVVTHDIAINQEGYITTEGIVSNINTSNFNEGEVLYLSPTIPGGITDVKPVAPDHLVKIGYSLNKTNNGKIFVTIDNGYELDELHNVRITNVQNGEIISYNSTSSIWVNTSAYNGNDVKSLTSNWENTFTNFSVQSSNNLSVYNTVNSNSASWIGGGGGDASVNSFVYSNSANILAVDSLVNSNSGNWDSTYNTVQSNSGTTWNYQGNDIKALTANWDATYNNFSVQSGNNLSVYSQVNTKSANWDSSYNTVNTYSSTTWNYQGNDIKALTANWDATFTQFSTQSSNNLSVYSQVNTNSSNWDSSYTTVNTYSSTTWNYQGTDIKALTANWQSSYTSLTSTSGNWDSAYTQVNSKSANWDSVYTTVNSNSASAFTKATIGITIDGSGSAITTGSKGFISVPYSCIINNNTIIADTTGSIVIDVKKSTYNDFPTTVSICAGAKPTLTSAIKSTDSTLTGWTTNVASGDIIEFVVDSATTITKATLTLGVTKI